MNYIDQILKELVDTSIPLTTPLLKAKLLAKKLKNEKLLTWVNNELNGYEHNHDLPEYRVFKGLLRGTYTDGRFQYNNYPVPLASLSKWFRENGNNFHVKESIGMVEKIANETEPGSRFGFPIPSDLFGMINGDLRKSGHIGGYLSMDLTLTVETLHQVLTSARSSLVDVLAELDEYEINLETINESNSISEINQTIYNIMEQKNITSYGDGTVNNIGDDNQFNLKISVKKNDFNSLKEYFKEQKLPDEDIKELESIINSDKPNIQKKQPGEKVSGWMGKMLTKAVNGGWKITAAAAGKILADGIGAYFGF